MFDLLLFDPAPLNVVNALYARADAGDRWAHNLASRLDEAFDQLETRPVPAQCRARRLRPPGLWMITIHAGGDEDDWAILWNQQDDDPEGTVTVRFLGSASFA